MTSANIIASVIPGLPVMRVRPAQLHRRELWMIAACVVPAMGLVALTQAFAGAFYLVASLAVFLGYQILRRDHHAFLCIGVGVLPVLMLLRGLFVYNSGVFVLGTGILLWKTQAPADVKQVWGDKVVKGLFILCVIYWWLSYLNTGEYANNLRLVELALSAMAVALLARRPSYLATALVGVALSISCLALGLLPHSTIRLGIAEVGETHLGNPILLGVPSVLMLLIVLSDRGQWMLLQQRLMLRLVIALVTAEWLIMSGSRGSWIAALSALLLLLVLSKGDRKPMAILVGLVVMVTGMALTTPLGEQIAQQYSKTMESERSMANRTSGRSAQWEALPDAFSKSPVWGWGPGVGREVVAYYTGRHLNWHSLYLHVAVETGSIGLICLATILIALGIRTVRFWRSDGSIMPMLALTAYIMIGVSVSAFDGNCGMFLGLALIGRQSVQRYELKEVVLTARAVRN